MFAPLTAHRFGALAAAFLLIFAVLMPVPAAANGVAAAKAAYAGRYEEARSLAQGDPAAEKLVEWVYLRNEWKTAGYDRINNFLNRNPGWPLAETLSRRAEQSLLHANESPEQIEAHFANGGKPRTADGKLALARAAAVRGDNQGARKWASRAWRTASISSESIILEEFSKLLTADDHKARLWMLIFAQDSDAAIRTARRLDKTYQRAAAAAKALFDGKPGADRAYNELPAEIRKEYAMRYALARFYRKADKPLKAADLLLKMPVAHEKLIDPEQVWIERRIVARILLGQDMRAHRKTAYKLASQHGYKDGPLAAEGEFLAGWIALRFLDAPKTALVHFNNLDRIVTNRSEKARSQYWLARTHAVMGNKERAGEAFRNAAQYPTVYYGQLAREVLGAAAKPINVDDIQPSAAVRERVENDELIRAFRIVGKTDQKIELNLFLQAFANRFDTPQEAAAAASVAWEAGGPHLAVKLAKATAVRGNDIDNWAYPTKAMPKWPMKGPGAERALVYGLARQESEFNATAGSGAGARGLMQLMPGTAKIIARQYKMPYDQKRLTADPAYNVTLGAAHLGDLVEEFEGSYVLSLVAYNAGPRRAVDWIEKYGDPRAGNVDPVDWVEAVPYAETRGYIQKVLQNTQVYRSRLDPGSMQGMMADLSRGRAGGAIAIADTDQTGTAKCGEEASDLASLIRECQ